MTAADLFSESEQKPRDVTISYDPNSVALILYTSGSTGVPKGKFEANLHYFRHEKILLMSQILNGSHTVSIVDMKFATLV